MITQGNILEVLKTVNETEQNKPLTELRMIKDIVINGSDVELALQFRSDHYPFRSKLEKDVTNALEKLPDIGKVSVTIEAKPKQPLMESIPLPNIKDVIVVSSGKGGVGKSTVSVHLAKAMHKQGFKVGLLDADAYGPNIPTILNCYERPTHHENKLIPVSHEGIKFLSLGSLTEPGKAVVWRGPMLHKMLRQFFTDVEWGELDYLIIDLPPGTGDVQLSIVQSVQLSGAVVVTTPQKLAVEDSKKGIHMFEEVNVDILGVIENMSYFQCSGCNEKTYLFGNEGGVKLAEEGKFPLLAQLPVDPTLGSADSEKGLEYFKPVVDTIHRSLHQFSL